MSGGISGSDTHVPAHDCPLCAQKDVERSALLETDTRPREQAIHLCELDKSGRLRKATDLRQRKGRVQ